jgi:hypothetical protein
VDTDVETLADRIVDQGCREATAGLREGHDTALAELRLADSVRRAAERRSQLAAESARAAGASWRQIGEAVGGITPQGAEHRFSPAAKARRSKASKAEWASRDRRSTPRDDAPSSRSYAGDRI